MAAGNHAYQGPWSFRDPLVAVRVEDLSTDPEVTIKVYSMYWPVTVDFGDEGAAVVVDAPEDGSLSTTVEYEYTANDDYTITVTCPKWATDSVPVTIAGV